MRRILVGLACAGLTVSCSGSSTPPSSSATADVAVTGTILVLAGPNPFSADVYKLRGSPATFGRISYSKPKLGVSAVTASCCVVLVADARDAGVDHLERLTRQGFASVPGLDPSIGREDPQFIDDTTLAFIEPVPTQTGAGTFSYTIDIRTFDVATRIVKTLLGDKVEVGAYAVRADGTLAFVELSADSKKGTLIVHDANGQSLMNLHGGLANDPLWLRWGGAESLLALGDITHRQTVLLSTDGSTKGHLDGWTALAWAPDGTNELLVTDGRRIAVWRTTVAAPEVIGAVTTAGGIYEATWTAKDPLQ